MKYEQNRCFQKYVILHSFKQNGLQIRNQRKKLHMVAPGKIIFRRFVFDFSDKCWILKVITSKTHRNEAFQPLGVLKNDKPWSKAAWSTFQSLF